MEKFETIAADALAGCLIRAPQLISGIIFDVVGTDRHAEEIIYYTGLVEAASDPEAKAILSDVLEALMEGME